VISCLESTAWANDDCALARQRLAEANIDVPAMIRHADLALAPVSPKWLADRLKTLWKSTVPAGSMAAMEWLAETGRLIKHLPLDIVAHAIDETIRRSDKGFTPTASEILKHANVLIGERLRIRRRLEHVLHGGPHPWKNEIDIAPEDLCSPEQAAEILASFGMKSANEAYRKTKREPTADDLADIAREMKIGQ
jgi:hypothetical protein